MLDLAGIGIGPFNLSIATLLNETDKLNYRFLITNQNLHGIQVCFCLMPTCKHVI